MKTEPLTLGSAAPDTHGARGCYQLTSVEMEMQDV